MDFTLATYEKLLQTLLAQGFSFLTFAQYIEEKSSNPKESRKKEKEPSITTPESSNLESGSPRRIKSSNLIILRHDVEARYSNALRMAQIEHQFGIKGSYYFRIFSKPSNEAVIKQIVAMGHEIGYHYDDLTACKGDYEAALRRFEKNLAYLREFAPVTTITMEGAPLSRYDNRDLWNQPLTPKILESLNFESSNPQIFKSTVHYSLFSITAEPYFDLNFNELFYITDTGRRWDGHRYNMRDKATKENPVTNPNFLKLRYHTTFDLINAIESSNLESLNLESFPPQAMLNFHPQRWNDRPIPWLKEFIWQNVKNQGKRLLLFMRE